MFTSNNSAPARTRGARFGAALRNSFLRYELAHGQRFWSGDCRGWAGEDEIDASRLEPVAVFVEVGVDAGGADDGVGGFEWNVFMVFEHTFEDAAEFAATPGEEAGAMGVAVDRGAIGELVLSGD